MRGGAVARDHSLATVATRADRYDAIRGFQATAPLLSWLHRARKTFLLREDNDLTLTARDSIEAKIRLGTKTLPPPPNCPDIAPLDHGVFPEILRHCPWESRERLSKRRFLQELRTPAEAPPLTTRICKTAGDPPRRVQRIIDRRGWIFEER